MKQLKSNRLTLAPMTHDDFELFVRDILTDPKVVEHYQNYRDLFDMQQIRVRAEKDFWQHFEASRKKYGCEIWSIFTGMVPADKAFIGWAGLVHTVLSDRYGPPELQFMLTSRAFGKGYATEAATLVIEDARERWLTPKIIATVDIPNKRSISVLEKLGFEFGGQIEAYGSAEMYFYRRGIANR
jgi:RimJ/RimL family protein N-acetyltransferase